MTTHRYGKCHDCSTRLRSVADGEEWCYTCQTYHRYHSHGWSAAASEAHSSVCPAMPTQLQRPGASQPVAVESWSRVKLLDGSYGPLTFLLKDGASLTAGEQIADCLVTQDRLKARSRAQFSLLLDSIIFTVPLDNLQMGAIVDGWRAERNFHGLPHYCWEMLYEGLHELQALRFPQRYSAPQRAIRAFA